MTMTIDRPVDQTDKSFIVTSDQLEAPERLPVRPFVGKLVKWGKRTQTFTNDDGSTRDDTFLRFWFDPLTAAAPWEDGLYMSEWRISKRVDSAYGCLMHHFDNAIEAVTGIPGKKFTDPDELIGMNFLVGEVTPKDAFWDLTYTDKKTGKTYPHVRAENREKMTKNYMAVLGAPMQGWESYIPENLDQLKLAAMQRAASRKADREAAKNGGSDTTSNNGGTTIPSFAETTVDISGYEELLASFLDGRGEQDNVVLAAMQDETLATTLGDRHQSIVFGLGSGAVQTQLLNNGYLTVTEGVYRGS